MAENSVESVFSGLRRFPDVEAPNLQAWDATDKLLLETAAGLLGPDSCVAVVGDRYGALTLAALAAFGVRQVKVHQDLITGERALRTNAAALGVVAGFDQLPLGAALFDGADVVLLQLPKTLAELEEVADAVARYAAPHAILLAGGRIKHMSLGMNAVLQRHFNNVQPQLARQKSRILIARDPKPVTGPAPFPVADRNSEIDLTVCARGAVFAGTKLDIGTRFLLRYLPDMPSAGNVVDLGCGTGILAAMYARSHPESKVTATDQSAAAVDSARATSEANGLAGRITVLQDDAMASLPDGSAGLILLNPPFHLGASVHAGAGIKMFRAAGRVLAPGGELWTVYNSHLQYLPALERFVGPTRVAGRNAKFTVAVSTGRAPHE
ncbi:SAM-dependent methyltransferase [Arthrobacter sp. SPG23]|uniref:class I SAM-dependent methyltransferase n=1 Tax=Arthrobacter sp. SPG23 TaxID=1610703 RepID=UPI0005BBE841|nr:class I SAM-dependent methyltransferase [Arthrobacter sp. SPG23]KIS27382.1 SAM-dependent methyltransferase [Arthrobacter sp. SPG23]